MEIWDLNLRHLRAIAYTAELGTLNAAASAVNLTQPAITQALNRIEYVPNPDEVEDAISELVFGDKKAQQDRFTMLKARRAALGHRRAVKAKA